MTDHELAMARARDYALSQRPPVQQAPCVDRRERDDVIAHLTRLQKSCDTERGKLEVERGLNAAMRAAVLKFGRRVRVTYWLGAALAAAMFGLGFYLIDRNRESIEVSCLVVVQVVRDSGANSGKPRDTPAGKAQARISTAFYTELLKGMTPARRAAVLRDQAIVRKAGGSIPEPRCAEVARDPGKVRRETLQKR